MAFWQLELKNGIRSALTNQSNGPCSNWQSLEFVAVYGGILRLVSCDILDPFGIADREPGGVMLEPLGLPLTNSAAIDMHVCVLAVAVRLSRFCHQRQMSPDKSARSKVSRRELLGERRRLLVIVQDRDELEVILMPNAWPIPPYKATLDEGMVMMTGRARLRKGTVVRCVIHGGAANATTTLTAGRSPGQSGAD